MIRLDSNKKYTSYRVESGRKTVNRRAFLTTVSTLALAGCATRLGLADRVEVEAKYVVVSERRNEDEDGDRDVDGNRDESEEENGADDPIELARRRYDPSSGPSYDAIHDRLADDIEPAGPLTISEATTERLEQSFEVVRYGMRGCGSLDGDDSDCRDTWLFLDDFNDLEVGDVVDVRYGEEMSGIVSVND